jgi:hypothetical protein
MGCVVPDKDHSGMWRSVKVDGILSDTAKLCWLDVWAASLINVPLWSLLAVMNVEAMWLAKSAAVWSAQHPFVLFPSVNWRARVGYHNPEGG